MKTSAAITTATGTIANNNLPLVTNYQNLPFSYQCS